MNESQRFEELKQPLSPLSLKGIYYWVIRMFMNTVGNISNGIKIGNQFGFDSGVMLDYVYKNKASGKYGLGALLDRFYLNSIGWKGIRFRKKLMESQLEQALRRALEVDDTIRYMDIACGGGEYDINVLKKLEHRQIKAELRDYKQENLEQAKRNSDKAGIGNIIYRQADAFDAANYTEEWDLIVSSGLWEIIDDDTLVKACLINCAKALRPGAMLLFTIQPEHPQLEMIARVLTSNTGKPWIMRLRSLELYKEWMKEAGLEYVSHQMEKYGIFGVVKAIKKTDKGVL